MSACLLKLSFTHTIQPLEYKGLPKFAGFKNSACFRFYTITPPTFETSALQIPDKRALSGPLNPDLTLLPVTFSKLPVL